MMSEAMINRDEFSKIFIEEELGSVCFLEI